MPVKNKTKQVKSYPLIGFVACYKGQTIATARDFHTLSSNEEVQQLLGKKGFVIKHTVPEGMLAVY